MSDHQVSQNLALFIDIENVLISINNHGMDFSIHKIMDRLSRHHRIVLQRSYGDISNACEGDETRARNIRKSLQAQYIGIEEIPYLNQFKNSADMKLTVDALSLAYSNNTIDTFAIFSADRDFMPLIRKLRELDKYVIGISIIERETNPIYVKAFDDFFYYETFYRRSNFTVNKYSLNEYHKTLCEAITNLEADSKPCTGAELMPKMKRIKADFNLFVLGMNTFGDLSESARKYGLVTHDRTPEGDLMLRLTDKGRQLIADEMADEEEEGGENGENILLRKCDRYFKEKLRLANSVPSPEMRNNIYRAVNDYINEQCGRATPQSLQNICGSVYDAEKHGNEQSAVYKIMYGLFRKHVLAVAFGGAQYNPNIAGVKVDVELWDDLFIENFLQGMKRDNVRFKVDAEVVSTYFGIEPAKAEVILNNIEFSY